MPCTATPRIACALRGTCARLLIAMAASIAVSLSGCATNGQVADVHRATEPYVGVFTGRLVDGLPLYRLPPIDVVGSRRSADGD
jgi:hypothetical protein